MYIDYSIGILIILTIKIFMKEEKDCDEDDDKSNNLWQKQKQGQTYKQK